MDENDAVKAPMTRLRRRLSTDVHLDDSSPSTPTTPNKRGRKAAKPELDLISENSVAKIETPKKVTRKMVEVQQEAEEKTITPSRRSTRIRSNTSLVVEAPQSVASPRAKRATRRNSLLGSDTETPLTPLRQTRRTRKDSTSSVEKGEVAVSKPVTQLTEAIAEEPENNLRKSISQSNLSTCGSDSGEIRRSPRILEKIAKTMDKPMNTQNDVSSSEIDETVSNKLAHITTEEIENKLTTSEIDAGEIRKSPQKIRRNSRNMNKSQHDDSSSRSDETVSNKVTNITAEETENKLTSDLDVSEIRKSPQKIRRNSRNMNKSHNDQHDNSSSKLDLTSDKKNNVESVDDDKEVMKKNNCISETINSTSQVIVQDKITNSIPTENIETVDKNQSGQMNKSTSHIYSKPKTNKKRTKSLSSDVKVKESNFFSDNEWSKKKIGTKNKSIVLNSPEKTRDAIKEILDADTKTKSSIECDTSAVDFFNKGPIKNGTPEIFIEDSDSNSNKAFEDQCVPVVTSLESGSPEVLKITSSISTSNTKCLSESVEPMDVDETMPESFIIDTEKTDSETAHKENPSHQSQVSLLEKSDFKQKEISVSQNLDKTENKSTLILSEVKDNSLNATSKLRKSSIIANNSKILSNSAVELDNTHNIDTNKKNLSLNCLTSTPLQNKTLKKVAVPLNASIITHNIDTNEIDKNQTNKHKLHTSKPSSNLDSSDEESSEGGSPEKNDLLSNEASDAGDDYESGDSRDEEDRRYEEQNEIIEKGQTLTSEDASCDDSDYEKDSFIVSSDEEDDQLLEGTDDDLSMSDNELKMTTKSKEKYNSRMIKEQKKASREMYEARHKSKKLKSNTSPEIQNTDSSDSSDSEVEKQIKQKKRIRMRLNSENLSENGSKTSSFQNRLSTSRKSNSLSESAHDKSNISEKEMTVVNEALEENDPLETVKKEPNSSLQCVNSTLNFVDAEYANNTQVNKDISNDPLEANTADDTSSDEDTNNIIQNYDSVLSNLNKSKQSKNKLVDTSLNLKNETKNKANKQRASIVDELNLTQPKSNLSSVREKSQTDKPKVDGKTDNQDEDSSDSIKLHLLFSEDSNQTADMNENNEMPLKQSEAVTDIRNNSDGDETDAPFKFFIDTKGDLDTANSTRKGSCTDEVPTIHIDSDAPEETPIQHEINNDISLNESRDTTLNKSKSKKRKEKRNSNFVEEIHSTEPEQLATSFVKTPKSDKKKKQNISLNEDDGGKTPKGGEKKNRSVSEVIDIDQDEPISKANASILKTPKSDKKKKQYKFESETTLGDSTEPEQLATACVKTPKSDKKKKQNISFNEDIGGKTPQDGVKKNGSVSVVIDIDQDEPISEANASIVKTPKSDKKKKKQNIAGNETSFGDGNNVNVSLVKTPKSDKKKKQNISANENNLQDLYESAPVNFANASLAKSPKSDKKKKQKTSTDANNLEDNIEPIHNVEVPVKTPKRDKKKQNLSASDNNLQYRNTETDAHLLSESLSKARKGDKKKKRKSERDNSTSLGDGSLNESNQKRKRMASPDLMKEDYILASASIVQEKQNKKPKIDGEGNQDKQSNKLERTKKRKIRNDDEDVSAKKVMKTSYLDTVGVSRLSAALLNKLDEKPRTNPKPPKRLRLISTSNFSVSEVGRRNKPSLFLEETVCLDQDSPVKKKSTSRMQKPRVLPTLPTAISSSSGYTTNFKIKTLPTDLRFVAEANSSENFRQNHLFNKKIKRLGTYELYKRQRNVKLTKF
ncbi:protein slender lobes isoform X2 [Leptidea sinapis]|uniref:protein slender lobes isoform X2 n=1 Tax=Leptidea sinapis TaxID=189913 RepID=UPI002142CBF0|nr:protein slender lobes isoform X2 [Leptidea sinapis]